MHTRSAVLWTSLRHDRLHLRLVRGLTHGRRDLFTKPASCRWAFALHLLLRCQLPAGSPAFHRTRISARYRPARPGLCRLGRFDGNSHQLEGSPEENEQVERTCEMNSISLQSRNTSCRKVRSPRPSGGFLALVPMAFARSLKKCLRKKEQDEVRRRKRAWRRGSCQEPSSQKQNSKF